MSEKAGGSQYWGDFATSCNLGRGRQGHVDNNDETRSME